MKMMKAWMLGSLAMLVLGAGPAWADPVPENDKDSLTITILPSLDFGVDIDTATTQFGSVALGSAKTLTLGTTEYLTAPAAVTVLGNFMNQELSVAAAGLDTWTVDTDDVAEADKVQVYALFSTLDNSVPTEAQFAQGGDYRHLVTGTPKWAGESLGSENNDTTDNVFEIPSSLPFSGGTEAGVGGGSDMDRLQVGNIRQLYLRVDAPPISSVSAEQEIQVTLTADSGVGH